MFHGYRRFVSLALSVCCILSMLYLDTYVVNAAISKTVSFNTRFYPNAISNNTWGSFSGGSGYISNGTGSISSITGSMNTTTHDAYTYHVSIPFFIECNWTDIGGSSNYNDNLDKFFTSYVNHVSINSTSGTVQNYKLYLDSDNYLLWDGNYSKHFYFFGGDVRGVNNDVLIPLRLEYDVSFEKQESIGVTNDPIDPFDSTFTLSFAFGGRYSNQNEIESQRLQVKEKNSQQIAQSNEAIKNSVTSETGTGLLATIKSFFGSFFDNIINSFKSLFIPEDGYFTVWFNRLNNLLADKLGMLYAPFDLVISTLTAIMNADSSETGIPFPGIRWQDTWLVEPFTFTFSSLGNDMSDLRDTVYFATDVVLLFAFLYLLEEKIRHILED